MNSITQDAMCLRLIQLIRETLGARVTNLVISKTSVDTLAFTMNVCEPLSLSGDLERLDQRLRQVDASLKSVIFTFYDQSTTTKAAVVCNLFSTRNSSSSSSSSAAPAADASRHKSTKSTKRSRVYSHSNSCQCLVCIRNVARVRTLAFCKTQAVSEDVCNRIADVCADIEVCQKESTPFAASCKPLVHEDKILVEGFKQLTLSEIRTISTNHADFIVDIIVHPRGLQNAVVYFSLHKQMTNPMI